MRDPVAWEGYLNWNGEEVPLSELRRRIAAGEPGYELGTGMTTTILPLLLPRPCCHECYLRLCRRCGDVGWTHNAYFPEGAYQCFPCYPGLADPVRERLAADLEEKAQP